MSRTEQVAPNRPPDGRQQRRVRSRARVVEAALALVRESGRLPSARTLAERVGLTERTVFNLFDGKDALLRSVVAAFREQAIADIPRVPTEAEPNRRVERFFEELTPFLEDYAAVRWAVLTSRGPLPEVEREVVLGTVHARVAELFAASGVELDSFPALEAAVKAAVDPLTWRVYRVQQRLDVVRSREAMVTAVCALIEAGRS